MDTNVLILALSATMIAALIAASLVVTRISMAKASTQSPAEKQLELMETKISGMKSDLRKLSGEWVEYHSRLDTLIRRGIRLGVLERQGAGPNGPPPETEPPAASGQSRSDLVSAFRRKHALEKSGT